MNTAASCESTIRFAWPRSHSVATVATRSSKGSSTSIPKRSIPIVLPAAMSSSR